MRLPAYAQVRVNHSINYQYQRLVFPSFANTLSLLDMCFTFSKLLIEYHKLVPTFPSQIFRNKTRVKIHIQARGQRILQ